MAGTCRRGCLRATDPPRAPGCSRGAAERVDPSQSWAAPGSEGLSNVDNETMVPNRGDRKRLCLTTSPRCTVWYMRYETSTTTAADPARLWAVLSDVERWPERIPTYEEVRRLDDGDLRVGSRAHVKQKGLAAGEWEVSELDEGQTFTWEPAARRPHRRPSPRDRRRPTGPPADAGAGAERLAERRGLAVPGPQGRGRTSTSRPRLTRRPRPRPRDGAARDGPRRAAASARSGTSPRTASATPACAPSPRRSAPATGC